MNNNAPAYNKVYIAGLLTQLIITELTDASIHSTSTRPFICAQWLLSGNRTYIPVVWLARPSHLIAGALRAGREGLAAVTIGSHLIDQSDATGRNSC